jgi:hypothetical protein
MQKTAISEGTDTLIKQHLLAALQKLSLRYKKYFNYYFRKKKMFFLFCFRRSVQTILINHNIIKWLIPLLGKTDRLSDYTLGRYRLL